MRMTYTWITEKKNINYHIFCTDIILLSTNFPHNLQIEISIEVNVLIYVWFFLIII